MLNCSSWRYQDPRAIWEKENGATAIETEDWPFYTRERIIRLDELGKTFVARLVIRL